MNTDKLNHFKTVYEMRSLSRASEFLNLSKTALSLSLKSLEQELGLHLFTRSNKNMLPTGEGVFLYNKISPLLVQFADVKNEIQNHKKEFVGPIRIGAPICFGSEKLVSFLRQYRKKLPAAHFVLTLDDGEAIKKKLNEGELDFAVVGDDVRRLLPLSVQAEKLFDYELTLCCSKKFYEENLKGVPLTEKLLLDFPFVSLKHVGSAMWFKKHFGREAEPKQNFSINNHHVHIQELLASAGLGLQSRYSVKKHLKDGTLVEIKPTTASLNYSFYGVQFHNQVPPRVLRKLLIDLKEYLYKKP